jgi:hypothetical protein
MLGFNPYCKELKTRPEAPAATNTETVQGLISLGQLVLYERAPP